MDAFEAKDGLVGVLGDFRSVCKLKYLLKLRNLALTQSLTCLPAPAFAICLLLGAATCDIWSINNDNFNDNINI